MDDSTDRQRIFESVMENSLPIRLANAAYASSPLALRQFLLLLYGAKCFLSLRRTAAKDSALIYFGAYPSEKKALGRIRRVLAHIPNGHISASAWNCLRPASIAAAVTFLPLSFRLWGFSRKVAVRHSFMPACRIFSIAAYYARARRLLEPTPEALVIASQYSPDSLGLACAIHAKDRKVFFANHADATGERRYVPPIEADLVIATCKAIAEQYQSFTKKMLKFAFLSSSSNSMPIRTLDVKTKNIRVGIYLTALTNSERLFYLIDSLSESTVSYVVFVREHPVKLVRPSRYQSQSDTITSLISRNSSLKADIERTDLAICGNSTVTTELLRTGVPVLYDSELDQLPDDLNGYIDAGLLMSLPPRLDSSGLLKVNEFYTADPWIQIMKSYDCGYLKDDQTVTQEFVQAIEMSLKNRSGSK